MRRGIVSALVVAALTGCSAQPAEPDEPPGAAASSTAALPTTSADGFLATAAPEQRAAAEEALKAYRAYMDAVVEARANPARVPDGLQRNSTDQALADELTALLTLQEQGIVFVGAPRLDPFVQDVDTEIGTATLADCQDNSAWTPTDEATGESRVAPGQETGLWIDATVRLYEDRWLVTRVKSDRSRAC